jgi:heterodisulfide reductase subunit C
MNKVALRDVIVEIVGNDKLKICQQCGKCAGDCPVAKVIPEHFNPRRLLQKILLNHEDEVFSEAALWLCAFCYRCQERCPSEVELPEIFLATRSLSVKRGHIPERPLAMVETMIKTGRTMETLEDVEEWRESIGLPRLGQRVSERALDEIGKIIEATRFKEKLRLSGK